MFDTTVNIIEELKGMDEAFKWNINAAWIWRYTIPNGFCHSRDTSSWFNLYHAFNNANVVYKG